MKRHYLLVFFFCLILGLFPGCTTQQSTEDSNTPESPSEVVSMDLPEAPESAEIGTIYGDRDPTGALDSYFPEGRDGWAGMYFEGWNDRQDVGIFVHVIGDRLSNEMSHKVYRQSLESLDQSLQTNLVQFQTINTYLNPIFIVAARDLQSLDHAFKTNDQIREELHAFLNAAENPPTGVTPISPVSKPTVPLYWNDQISFGEIQGAAQELPLQEKGGYTDPVLGKLIQPDKAGPELAIFVNKTAFGGIGHLRGLQLEWMYPDETILMTLDLTGDQIVVRNAELGSESGLDNRMTDWGECLMYHIWFQENPQDYQITYVEYEYDGEYFYAGNLIVEN